MARRNWGLRDVAGRVGVSEKSLRRLLRDGRMPAAERRGRRLAWPPYVIENWLRRLNAVANAAREQANE